MNPAITLAGSYPRTEELVKATWNADKGLLTPAQLRQAQEAASADLVALQARLGFSPLSDGLLPWQDIFRPLVESSPSFEVGGVTRLFENNKFYRQPILHQAPRLDWKRLEAYFPHSHAGTKKNWKAILPSPYWFTRVAKDNVYHDEHKLGHALATYVNEAARKLQAAGYAAIQFNEAWLFYEKTPDVGLANELFATATEGLQVETVANFMNGNAAPHHSFLQTVPVTRIGIDFVETLPEKMPPRLQGRPVLAQVVNAQESLVETPDELAALVKRVRDKLKPSDLQVSHTWDLDFVPHEVAVKKLEALATLRSQRKVAA